MSFPAILMNAKLVCEGSPALRAPAKRTRDDREGKRWLRRKENVRFTGNPHIVNELREVDWPAASMRRTFPDPLPRFLPRSVDAPSPPRPGFDVHTANSGRYSMSLKGMRRTLRGHGPWAQMLVHDVEHEVLDWLVGGTMLLPDAAEDDLLEPGRPIGEVGSIMELSRTPLKLIWRIEHDAFVRYIVHCCARYHKVVSYSKDLDGRRLTYLLRPNVTRPDYTARDALDTPPATESDYSFGVLSETDIISVEENEPMSDAISDEVPPTSHRRRLSSVTEQADELGADATPCPLRSLPFIGSSHAEVTSDIDADDDKSVVSDVLVQSFESLDLNPAYREPPIRYSTPPTERTPLRDRRGVSRASSSPSRSPCPPSRIPMGSARNRLARHRAKQSFYHYLYS